MPTQVARARGIKRIPRADHELYLYGGALVTKFTNNVNYTSPGQVVTNLATANTTFWALVQSSKTQKDTGEAVAQARQAVVDAIGHLVEYANSVVEKLQADAGKAALQSGGLESRKATVRNTPEIDVKYGGLMGMVLLVARSMGKGCAYAFEFSTDQKNWTSCPTSIKVKTTVSGLTVGTTYYFRVQATTRKGLQNWSTIVCFVVH